MKHIKTFEQFVNEAKIYFIEVATRDAKKALNYLDDSYRKEYKKDSSNHYTFKDEDTAMNVLQDFEDIDIEVTNSNLSESVNEGRGPETVKEPKAKDIQVKDKYKKGEGIFYRVIFPASTMVANSKSETSKNVYYARIDKVTKDGRGEPVYVVGWDKIPHNMVIGTKLNESEVNEGSNDEGDAKVLSFLKRLAKDWDIPVEDAVRFVQASIKRNGY